MHPPAIPLGRAVGLSPARRAAHLCVLAGRALEAAVRVVGVRLALAAARRRALLLVGGAARQVDRRRRRGGLGGGGLGGGGRPSGAAGGGAGGRGLDPAWAKPLVAVDARCAVAVALLPPALRERLAFLAVAAEGNVGRAALRAVAVGEVGGARGGARFAAARRAEERGADEQSCGAHEHRGNMWCVLKLTFLVDEFS